MQHNYILKPCYFIIFNVCLAGCNWVYLFTVENWFTVKSSVICQFVAAINIVVILCLQWLILLFWWLLQNQSLLYSRSLDTYHFCLVTAVLEAFTGCAYSHQPKYAITITGWFAEILFVKGSNKFILICSLIHYWC